MRKTIYARRRPDSRDREKRSFYTPSNLERYLNGFELLALEPNIHLKVYYVPEENVTVVTQYSSLVQGGYLVKLTLRGTERGVSRFEQMIHEAAKKFRRDRSEYGY